MIFSGIDKSDRFVRQIWQIIDRHWQIWKSLCIFFADTCFSSDHDIIGGNVLLTKPIKFGVNGKRMLWVIDLQKMSHYHDVKWIWFTCKIIFATTEKKSFRQTNFFIYRYCCILTSRRQTFNFVNPIWFLWILKCFYIFGKPFPSQCCFKNFGSCLNLLFKFII